MAILNKYYLFCLIIIFSFETSFSQSGNNMKYDSIEVKNNDFKKTNSINEDKDIVIYSHESRLIGKDAVSFAFYSYSGHKITLKQYKGKILVLDFWESWCGKCISSFSDVNRIAIEYKDKGIEILGITTENRKNVSELIKSNKLIYSNIFADKNIINDYEVAARPTYIIVNAEGKIIFVSHGNLGLIERKLKQLTSSKTG
jgi:peroxiredoxin